MHELLKSIALLPLLVCIGNNMFLSYSVVYLCIGFAPGRFEIQEVKKKIEIQYFILITGILAKMNNSKFLGKSLIL